MSCGARDGFHHTDLAHLLRKDRGDGVDHQKAAEQERQQAERAQQQEDRRQDLVSGMLAGLGHIGEEHLAAALHLVGHPIEHRLDVRLIHGVFGDGEAQAAVLPRVPPAFGGIERDITERLVGEAGRRQVDIMRQPDDGQRTQVAIGCLDGDRIALFGVEQRQRVAFDQHAVAGRRPGAALRLYLVDRDVVVVGQGKQSQIAPLA